MSMAICPYLRSTIFRVWMEEAAVVPLGKRRYVKVDAVSRGQLGAALQEARIVGS